MKTRLIVRALIQRGDEMLVNDTKHGVRLLGGRVKKSESLRDAVVREVFEEIGVRVHPRDMVNVSERLGKQRTIEFVFRCHALSSLDELVPEKGIRPRWVPRASFCGWNNVIAFSSEPARDAECRRSGV